MVCCASVVGVGRGIGRQKVSDTCEVWPPSAPNVGTCNRDKKKLTHWRWDWVRAKCAKVYLGIVFDGVNRILFAVAVRKI